MWTEDVAKGYDNSSALMYTPDVLDPVVEFLAEQARSGRVLEFAIGTGRVALPLKDRGLEVVGIEMSEPMAAQLRAKPGAQDVPVVIGDMATATAPGEFSLVYGVYNCITCLLTQDEQVQCFENAARHLAPGGAFVIEVTTPDIRKLPVGETARPFHVGDDHVGFNTYDLVNQHLVSHHYWFLPGDSGTFKSPHRYVWPSELDLMARIAGLELIERWADFNRASFEVDSPSHVSVWRKRA